jgi:hypothetical protein
LEIELTDNQINIIADIVAAKVAAAIEAAAAANADKRAKVKGKPRNKKFLKISEFAEEFNVTPAGVHKWILHRKIFAQKIGDRIWRIPASEVEDFRKRNWKKTKEDYFK